MQISPDEFWKLTDGELSAKLHGYNVLRELRSADFRNLYTLNLNLNRGKNQPAQAPEKVWPLSLIDKAVMDIEERLKAYGRMEKNWK